jgi:tyramine---L-glutamate ligase
MRKLKILVFEYITGGGLNKSELPESLAREGLLMLRSLVNDLAGIDDVEMTVMLDFRLVESMPSISHHAHIIGQEQDYRQEFVNLLQTCDAVWPIAPESDDVLQTLCEAVERSGKILLASPSHTVAIAADKWLTYCHLTQHSIDAVPTQRLVDFDYLPGQWMLKPVDGVGCMESFLITNQQGFEALTANIDQKKYIIQPHISGDKTSLSCLFKQGRGWLLCANRQHFRLINKRYHLTGITVNFTTDISNYVPLVNALANAMPGLWGYVGIDLIETANEILVLEINPRLTTSYAGTQEALGINCANAVLDLLTGEPRLQATCNRPVRVNVMGKESHVG